MSSIITPVPPSPDSSSLSAAESRLVRLYRAMDNRRQGELTSIAEFQAERFPKRKIGGLRLVQTLPGRTSAKSGGKQ
jgi:hypothetical protein